MPTFAVNYRYAEHSEGARADHRPAHVAFLRGEHDAGRLYMSGPLAADPPRALLVFEAADEAALRARLDDDPFHVAGLIADRTVTQWNVFFDPRSGGDA